jgi:hypothetical protein
MGLIIRAIFWVALVAFLMPHEPDLGYGKPGNRDGVRAAHLGAFEHFRALGLRSLEDVRADLKAHRSHASI